MTKTAAALRCAHFAWLYGPLAIWAMSFPVRAQTDSSTAADTPTSPLAEVVVTGTHITSTGYQSPTPVTSAAVEDLTKGAPTDIADALNKLPQFVGLFHPEAG